jgi:hypothetical protein
MFTVSFKFESFFVPTLALIRLLEIYDRLLSVQYEKNGKWLGSSVKLQ